MPNPKDPIKFAEYREKQRLGSLGRKHTKEAKEKMSKARVGFKHTEETKRLLSDKFKVIAKEKGFGKRMKGRKDTPFLQQAKEVGKFRKGKTYNEIYGDRAEEEALKRRMGNRNHRKDKVKKYDTRPKHNSDYRYIEWRKGVFERDNYTCQNCGISNKKGLGKTIQLNAHHIKQWKDYVDLRYVVSNGLCLCAECHKLAHKRD